MKVRLKSCLGDISFREDGATSKFPIRRYLYLIEKLEGYGSCHSIGILNLILLKEGADIHYPCKIFVGRISEDITIDDLQNYFSRFGEVTDVYIPKPFRSFAFVTFDSPEIVQNLIGEDYIIKGVSVHVSEASPRYPNNARMSRIQRNNFLHGVLWSANNGRSVDSKNRPVNHTNNSAAALLSAFGVNSAAILSAVGQMNNFPKKNTRFEQNDNQNFDFGSSCNQNVYH